MRYRAVLYALIVASAPASGQAPRPQVAAADYARAEGQLGANTIPLVFGATVRPSWLADGRLWYRNTIEQGREFILVDPATRTRRRAFDHQRLSSALSAATGTPVDPFDLPFAQFTFTQDGQAIVFDVDGTRFTCDTAGDECAAATAPDRSALRSASVSPDGTWAVFIRDSNLWVHELATGAERPLTSDGVEDFGYGTDNAGWVRRNSPVLLWSPDSRKIATFQHDARGVGEMHLVSTDVGHSTLTTWRYPLPGDSVIFRIHRVVIDVETARTVRLQMPPDPHRSTTCDHVVCNGVFTDVEWSPDGSQLAFVSSSRDHKEARLRVADVETGEVRDVLDETVDTFFESGDDMVNWHFLPESNEVIWYSQRSDWGHLYLYDLSTGRLKHQITAGDWNVLQLRYIDEENRTLYLTGAGREPGDPYFQYFYKVGMDGGNLTLLTPDSANHAVTMSPSGRYFVDSYSTPVEPPVTVLRDTNGATVVEMEEADVSRLLASGWQPPIPFTVKARDGVTDLHGLMYRPANFDPSRSYPILNPLYPGPQSGSVGSRSFRPSRGDKQALAELGFIVVEVDAMGTPMRSKSFQAAYYGNMGDNGLPDQVTMIRQLAARHSWMDLDRVGIWGHSGGGFASTAGILQFPDFYKVAVSQAGNHDNRNYEDDWGEKWQGLLEEYPDGSTNYDNQANQLQAENLRGKLLLAHGTMDSNVPPSSTLLLVDRLIAANKDFDLIMLPNRRHGFANEPYMMRRRWDYFVQHLLGADPPSEYEFGQLPVPLL